MRPTVWPSEILRKRLDVIRALLGPGWLGMTWCDWHANGITSTDVSPQSWRSTERLYNCIVKWLMPGLARISDGQEHCSAGNGGVAIPASLEPAHVPSLVLDILRRGLAISPAGIGTCCRLTAYDLLHCIIPLLGHLYCLHDHRLAMPVDVRPVRCLALLAGVPGAGKSVVASVVECFSQLLVVHPRIQVIGMDGWHYPNDVLRARQLSDETGRTVPLISRKGSPQSFDVQALRTTLRRLLIDAGTIRVPVYDRGLHEPVTDAVAVDAPLVLAEGNYLLMGGPQWEPIGQIAEVGIWLEVPLDVARARIVARHKALGRPEQESIDKWRHNDWPNSLAALRGRGFAGAVIQVDDDGQMNFVPRL